MGGINSGARISLAMEYKDLAIKGAFTGSTPLETAIVIIKMKIKRSVKTMRVKTIILLDVYRLCPASVLPSPALNILVSQIFKISFFISTYNPRFDLCNRMIPYG